MMKIFILFFFFISISAAQLLHRPSYVNENVRLQQIPYDAVISYLPVTKIFDITEDQRYYYLATNGGIWRYHIYDEEWDFPITKSQGLPQNAVIRVYYWAERDVLYAETPSYHCLFIPTWEMWQNIPKNSHNQSWPGGINLKELIKSMKQVKSEKIKPVNSLPRQATIPLDRRYHMRADGALISPAGETFDFKFSFTSFREDIIFAIDNFGIGLSNEYDVAFKSFRLSIPDVNLRDMFIDNDLFWYGGFGNKGYNNYGAIGLWPNLKDSWEHYYKLNSSAFAQSFSVNRFYGDMHNLFAATDNGILEYDNSSDEWLTIPGSANKAYSNIKHIAKIDTLLWLGTEDGLIAWDLEIDKFMYRKNPLSNTRIYDLKADNNYLYIAANQGLHKMAKGTLIAIPINYLTTVVGGLPRVVVPTKNEFWVGTEMGWVWYNKKEQNWDGILLSNFRLQGPVIDMIVDEQDAFFLLPKGFIHWNREKDIFRWFNKKAGIAQGSYQRIILDGDAIWCLTNNGATQIFYNEVNY